MRINKLGIIQDYQHQDSDLKETESRWNDDGTFEIREEVTENDVSTNLVKNEQSEKDQSYFFREEIFADNIEDIEYNSKVTHAPGFDERK